MTVRSIFILIFSLVSGAFARPAEAQTDVLVLGILSIDGDDRVAETITDTLRVVFETRSGWSHVERASGGFVEVMLTQMLLAHGCDDSTDRECLGRIGGTFLEESPGLDVIVFGRMRRRGAGADEVTLDLLLFEISEQRVTHRLRLDATISDLIIRGSIGTIASGWIDRLVSDDQRFEDTGQLYFDPFENPPPGNPHVALEIAGWSLVGLAGVSALVAAVSGGLMLGHNGDERYNAYRSSWDSMRVGNVCEAAASDPSEEGRYALGVCNDAQIHEVLVPLLWTVAAIAGATGIVLAWHPWTITPVVGPSRAGLDLTIAF